MKSDRVYVVLPKYFRHGKSTLLWALLNVAKNGERLFIVHVHRHKHISPKALEKIDEYVSMCNERKVSCVSSVLKITKNDDVAKELAKLIDREGITKLVMRGAAGKRYSEGMKSLEFNTAIELMNTTHLTCKIWFTCNGQLICTRKANATVPAIQPPPVDSLALKRVKEKNDQQSAMTLLAETVNTEFSKYEIQEAMQCFGNTPIGKGRSGSVYKGCLRNTDVAIKILDRGSIEGEFDLDQKVGVLGRVRHPNLVTLIGVCREVLGLVYEFLPNGSLQDLLVACRNGMRPLKWRVRIKIIREVWTVLTFLHLSKPPLVHGNLKASKVLLDSNHLACKLEAFGISQSTTRQHDVHSFGIIVLQLLTGLLSPEKDVVKVVEEAMEKGELHTVVDPTAGNWPIALANQLGLIGLHAVRQDELPDLAGDVWKVLESRKNAGILTSGQDDDGPPNYFICPITNDVMEDPHFAADGHTYEHEAILQWIHGEHGKSDKSVRSPTTNLKLEHLGLTRNLALNSEIKEWKEKQRQRQVRSLADVPGPEETSRIRGKLKHE